MKLFISMVAFLLIILVGCTPEKGKKDEVERLMQKESEDACVNGLVTKRKDITRDQAETYCSCSKVWLARNCDYDCLTNEDQLASAQKKFTSGGGAKDCMDKAGIVSRKAR